jgi:hypothetical protein
MYVLSIVVCPFVLFLLAIVLSVLLRYTVSDCPFGIFKLYLEVVAQLSHYSLIFVYSQTCIYRPLMGTWKCGFNQQLKLYGLFINLKNGVAVYWQWFVIYRRPLMQVWLYIYIYYILLNLFSSWICTKYFLLEDEQPSHMLNTVYLDSSCILAYEQMDKHCHTVLKLNIFFFFFK